VLVGVSSRPRAPARTVGATLALALAGCPAPQAPSAPAALGQTFERGRPGAVLSSVAGDGTVVLAAFAAVRPAARTVIEALAGTVGAPPRWQVELDGLAGPLAMSGGHVVVGLAGTGTAAGVALRGEPGAVVASLDAATGAVAWKLAVDSNGWSQISSLAALPDGAVIGGSFSGTLRIAGKVVSSAGKADGFVARLTAAGDVAWLIRLGGPGADAVQGVAASGDRIAIAGTFSTGAELSGQPLPSFEERTFNADGFVAELDHAGTTRWSQTFGGEADEAVAGVALDAHGRVAVAATVRATVKIGGAELVTTGPAEGLLGWWDPGGKPGMAVLVGGGSFDGLRVIAAVGDQIVVGGFYSGTLQLGARTLRAAGGDDAFVAAFDPTGNVAASWPVSGDGREEITALAAIPGGFIAGIAHSAAVQIERDALPAPRDPLSGTAIIVRAVR